MNGKMKIVIPVLAVVLLLAVTAIWFLRDNGGHIQDTNGANDYSLHTITDDNIRKLNTGALNVDVQTDTIGQKTYLSDCFTGVYEVFAEDLVAERFEIVVNNAEVNAGNFKMVLCVDDEIVHTFANNQPTQKFLLEEATGTVSLRIAGESADFMFDYYIYNFEVHEFSMN